jgi:hypothetical protein
MLEKINFNNREIAIFIILTIGLIFTLRKKEVRKSIWNFIKAFFEWKILVSIFLMSIYIGLVTFILSKVDLWDPTLLKDTVYWFVSGAIVLYVNVFSDVEKDGYFKRLIVTNLGAIIIVEFVLNLYAFNLLIELISMFIIFWVSLMKGFSEYNKVDRKVVRILDFILIVYGLGIFAFTVYHIVINPNEFFTIVIIKTLLLPFVYTFLFIPWLYMSALYMIYELEYVTINHLLRDNKKLARAFRKQIFYVCKFDLRKIKIVSKELKILMIKDISDLKSTLSIIVNK